MLNLLKYIDGDWPQVRGYLYEDLCHIEAALNQRWNATFGDANQLKPGAVDGDFSHGRRYVANTGVNHAPKWDKAVSEITTDDVYIEGGPITETGEIAASLRTSSTLESARHTLFGAASI